MSRTVLALLALFVATVVARTPMGADYCSIVTGFRVDNNAPPSTLGNDQMEEPRFCDVYECPAQNGTAVPPIQVQFSCTPTWNGNTALYPLLCQTMYNVSLRRMDSQVITTIGPFFGSEFNSTNGNKGVALHIPRTHMDQPLPTGQEYRVVLVVHAPSSSFEWVDRVFPSHKFTILCDNSGYMYEYVIAGYEKEKVNIGFSQNVNAFTVPPNIPARFIFTGRNINTYPVTAGGDQIRLRLITGTIGNYPAFPCYDTTPADFHDECKDLDVGNQRNTSMAFWTWQIPHVGVYAVCFNIYTSSAPGMSSAFQSACKGEQPYFLWLPIAYDNCKPALRGNSACTGSSCQCKNSTTKATYLNRKCNDMNVQMYSLYNTAIVQASTAIIGASEYSTEMKKLITLVYYMMSFGDRMANGTSANGTYIYDTPGTMCGTEDVISAACPQPDTTVTLDYLVQPNTTIVNVPYGPADHLFWNDIPSNWAIYNELCPADEEEKKRRFKSLDESAAFNEMVTMACWRQVPPMFCDAMETVRPTAPAEGCRGRSEGQFIHLPSVLVVGESNLTCKPVMFWGIEGTMIHGDLTNIFNPDVSHINPHLPLDTHNQNPSIAVSGCSGNLTFELVRRPVHHSGGLSGLINSTFTLTAEGRFIYLQYPDYNTPELYNGFDSFTFSATCKIDRQPDQTCSNGLVQIKILPCQVDPCPKWVLNWRNQRPVYGDQSDLPPWKKASRGERAQLQCDSTQSCPESLVQVRHEYNLNGVNLRTWDTTVGEFDVRGDGKSVQDIDIAYFGNTLYLKSYGYIGNYAQRFATLEIFEWTPQRSLTEASINTFTSNFSTSFRRECLLPYNVNVTGMNLTAVANKYHTATSTLRTNNAHALENITDDDMTIINSTIITVQPWKPRFQGEYSDCSAFNSWQACNKYPLLIPNYRLWNVDITACSVDWTIPLSWNTMHELNQERTSTNKPMLFNFTNQPNGDINMTFEMYNTAIQPNDWLISARGWDQNNKKWTITLTLASTLEFRFEMGIEIFTVDLEYFRYTTPSGGVNDAMAFGVNMIIYPLSISSGQWQQNPDRRIKAVEFYAGQSQCHWPAPTGTGITDQQGCAEFYAPSPPSITLSLGPTTSATDCINGNSADPFGLVYIGVPGLSPADPQCNTTVCICQTAYQNVTIRAVSTTSKSATMGSTPTGFNGRIIMQFTTESGEKPTFTFFPKLLMASLCVRGSFSGSTATCRADVNWPVNPNNWKANAPNPWNLCLEPDARTFGPIDWAVIMFDIKDVPRYLISVVKLSVQYTIDTTTTTVVLECDNSLGCVGTAGPIPYWMHYHALTEANLTSIDATPNAPHNMDWGFMFTPGAMNENMKITIYCTLRVMTDKKSKRFQRSRFASLADDEGKTEMQHQINVDKRFTPELRAGFLNQVLKNNGGNQANAGVTSAGSSATSTGNSMSSIVSMIALTAGVCIGMIVVAAIAAVWYVRRATKQASSLRVPSTADMSSAAAH